MSSSEQFGELSDDQLQLVHQACQHFERALRKNDTVSIESQLKSAPVEIRDPLFRELLAVDLEFRITNEIAPNIDEYLVRFPGDKDNVHRVFEEADAASRDDEAQGSKAAIGDLHGSAVGSVIGPYKLRELIGEGGMGLVYIAEQEAPVRRQVALKIIKPGMDTKEVIARFESERQALALMDHPHIAHVLDAGATDTGRPYFVMELIRGVPVTEYCNKHKLSTRARLELFMQICLAVQHAHQKGIIHRDIKPTNILITRRGVGNSCWRGSVGSRQRISCQHRHDHATEERRRVGAKRRKVVATGSAIAANGSRKSARESGRKLSPRSPSRRPVFFAGKRNRAARRARTATTAERSDRECGRVLSIVDRSRRCGA